MAVQRRTSTWAVISKKKRYDDLELIFRDQDHIERFLSYGASGVDW